MKDASRIISDEQASGQNEPSLGQNLREKEKDEAMRCHLGNRMADRSQQEGQRKSRHSWDAQVWEARSLPHVTLHSSSFFNCTSSPQVCFYKNPD